MPKRYFSSKKKSEPSLTRIMLLLTTLMIIAYGVNHFARWFNTDIVGAAVEASAMTEIEKARRLFQEGYSEKARELLRPILARVDKEDITPHALELMADIEEAGGDVDKALELLKLATDSYATAPQHPTTASRYARLLDENGRYEEAYAVYASVRDNAPAKMRAAALVGIARKAEREENMVDAQTIYQQAFEEAEWDSPGWNEALDAIGRINVAQVFSIHETPDSKKYTVVSGDSLTNIGIKLNTTQGLLIRANGITDPSRIRLNQQLKFTPKDFRVVIERSKCRIFLLDGEGIFKRYHTGLGMPGHETTLGHYTVGSKSKNPTWYKPGGRAIPPGDPENELGTRWIPLVPADEGLPTDLGIHGTIAPETIGEFKSHGCPRLHNAEAEELYDLIVRSTSVEIVETVDPETI